MKRPNSHQPFRRAADAALKRPLRALGPFLGRPPAARPAAVDYLNRFSGL